MKVKTQDLKPNAMLDKRKWKYEHRALSIEHRFLFLTCWLLPLFAGVAIASEQADPADLSAPQVIAPHQLDVSLARLRRASSIGAGPPDANTPNFAVVKKPPQDSFYIAGTPLRGNPPKPISQSAQQLWQSRISVPQSEKDKKYRDELRRLIAQIRSIKFEPKNQEPKPVIAIEPAPDTRNEARGTKDVHSPSSIAHPSSIAGPDTTEEASATGGTENDYEPVSDQTLQMLKNLSQQPDQLHNPLELAEILFLSGNLKQATMFYQQALNRKDPNDVTSAQNRAWILFQIGNCLRDDDLPAAKKMYRQLIAEYLNSPWTDLAKARQNLIDWYLNDKPRTLIAECKSCLSADRF